jgi:hypothetical protein
VKKAPPSSRDQAKRAALNALKRASRAAARAGFGRAFADPDKGAAGAPLSMMQAVKLKEITAKAKGEKPRAGRPARKGFGRRARPAEPDLRD